MDDIEEEKSKIKTESKELIIIDLSFFSNKSFRGV
jgi:hypothetical protein